MDALSGRLLRLDETMEERNLTDKDHLFANVLIDAKDGVNFDLSDNELLQDCRRFIDYNRDVLNANISKVRDISFQGMHYVKSFLMALKDESILLFFRTAQRKGGKKRISVLMTNQEGKRHFPQENVPLMDEDSERRIIRSIMRIQLSERGKSAEEIGRKEMLETIAGFYDFRDYRLNEERREIVLNADSFSGYDRDLPFLLRQFSARGWILFTSRQLRGEFLKAVVKDERLKRAAESYSAYEKKNGFNAAQSALKEACERFEGRIIDAIESLSGSSDLQDY